MYRKRLKRGSDRSHSSLCTKRSVHFRVLFAAVVSETTVLALLRTAGSAAQKKKSKRTQQRVPPTSKAEQQQADIKIIPIEKSSTE